MQCAVRAALSTAPPGPGRPLTVMIELGAQSGGLAGGDPLGRNRIGQRGAKFVDPFSFFVDTLSLLLEVTLGTIGPLPLLIE